MVRPIIAIDADLTLLDSALGTNGWFDWLQDKGVLDWTYYRDTQLSMLDYNLGNYFTSFSPLYDQMDFWRSSGLYDWVHPVKNAVRAVKELSEIGTVIVVSSVKGLHWKTKVNRLKTLFPQFEAFIATKEKQYVRCDYLIDDRSTFLNKMPDSVKKIRFQTPFRQDEPDHKDTIAIDGWDSVVEYIKRKENNLE